MVSSNIEVDEASRSNTSRSVAESSGGIRRVRLIAERSLNLLSDKNQY
jgi:hypothetical protein